MSQPRGTGPRWGAQWSDPAMAEAYDARHPYPDELFDVVAALAGDTAPVCEIGAGNGRLTFGLADRVAHVDAIEPSTAMISAAGRTHERVRWINATFEDAPVVGPYRLVVGGESVHWLDWPVAFPKLRSVLADDGLLALVGIAERQAGADAPGPWPFHEAMMRLIVEYSVNDEFEPYELVSSLKAGGWFEELGRHSCAFTPVDDPVARVLRRMHSANGLGLGRLGAERAAEFDRRMTEVLAPHAVDGVLRSEVGAVVVWGRPLVSGAASS